ncbi:aminoacylase [Leifsonia sp. LS1]|uniref:N-acyl-D-amino-acid deacylase family protein n=1 Tax=Leifsonia sp. LS1 TaxID=2828483 RepID=UPI001CFCBA49|nr:amidohydrolase family protein [Leifsonia sp. LS1]GIT82193.1 aminoacylase [Leifsonia sp. LS1]
MSLDLAIRNGWLVDGSGDPRRIADVGIAGDRIVQVGRVGHADIDIDATGLIVAPGFVDPHSHSDWTIHSNPGADSTIRQGVTTEIVGNCGLTNAPVTDASAAAVQARMHSYAYDGPVGWRSFGEYLADVESLPTAQNLAFFVGHSTLREAAGVGAGVPSEAELSAMDELLCEALEAGALGMSSGLEYSFGASATQAELEQLARTVGRYGGIYASHVRNRDAAILNSIEEFLAVMRAGNAAGQISHLNVRDNTGAPERGWERAVDLMMQARARGFDVQADATPFRQGLGIMTGVLPGWVREGGPAATAHALADPSVRERLKSDCDRYWRFLTRGQWDRARLQNSLQLPELNGLTLTEIASRRRSDPWDAYFDVLMAAGEGMDNLTLVGDLFTEEHLSQTISHPLFNLGVDAFTSTIHGPLAAVSSSPLPYSGHIHYLTHHVRERGTLPLEEAVRKMTSMPAARFDLHGRGLIRHRYFADLVVFDYDRLRSDSTFEHPAAYPEGVRLVVVNGAIAVDGGHPRSHPRAGRVLRRRS